ncbi:MAG: AAA family ATPase [Thermoleophilia bacterium]|nr:AAA family ATPase [Thermoleophilia bacterium]
MLRSLRIENLVLVQEAELSFAPGLNAITGETGAGKTILAQALGLLLGARAEAGVVGAAGEEAYVEAELDLADAALDELDALNELRPAGEDTLVLARRVFSDGRTRAYAWGRSLPREDVAAAAERLVAMSGQFEQRRLARPSYQLDVLDAFAGATALRAALRTAWRDLTAARRRSDEAERESARAEERLAELRALVEDAADLERGAEDALRAERERLRHVAELGHGAAAAAEALAPEDGEGAGALLGQAESALAPLERLAPELGRVAEELRDADVRVREAALELRAFIATLDAEPGRLDEVEARLDAIAAAKRRYGYATYDELVERAAAARAELGALEAGDDPDAAAQRALAEAQARVDALLAELRGTRRAAADAFAAAVSERLASLGLGAGEFAAELREAEPGPAGADAVSFLIRPNAGLPRAPVAETASGGELSRIALAIAAVAGGETMVFDEIDAGIGGRTAHAVAALLEELAGHGQVITITHLPQIASRAERHFRVEKVPGDPTHTRIQPLAADERRGEIERMLGGREFLELVSQASAG